MSTRELIRAKVDQIPDGKLDELYRLIEGFQEAHASTKPGILAKLRTVTITCPADFSANLKNIQ